MNKTVKKAIVFNDVKYKYPQTERCVLSNLSVSIPYGKCSLITGPTGSGKSTFIFLTRGLYKQLIGSELKGKILLHGKDIETLNFSDITRMGIGWVGQNPSINLHQLTVQDEILSSPIYFNLPWSQCTEIANEMMERMRISNLASKAPFELSGGQMQRVAIAAALSMSKLDSKYELLLLDEPSSLLDPVGKQELAQLLLELKKQGVTIVIATHDIGTFARLADKMILIVGGRKIMEGETQDVLYSNQLDKVVGAPLFVKIIKEFKEAAYSKPVSTQEILTFFNTHKFSIISGKEKKTESPSEKGIAISFHNVTFRYTDELVFKRISCKIPAKKIVAIIGNNGSGKTTLVKLGLGLLKPQDGKILLFGKDPTKYSAKELAQTVAYITQVPKEMFITNTVKEECRITPKILKMKNIEEIIEKAIRKANLMELRNSPVDSLSGGEQRLLTFASTALITNAKLLILDEPEYGVDSNTWWYIFDMLRQFRDEGRTIIMLTHFIDATVFCDHIMVLSDGKLIDQGPPLEIYKKKDKLRKARITPPLIMPIIEQIFDTKIENIDDLMEKMHQIQQVRT